MHRTIRGLVWAGECEEPPHAAGRKRLKGPKAKGISYEREMGRALGAPAIHGQWFQFRDANGWGKCQTDFLIFGEKAVWVLESKYTWVSEGHSQINQLYRPVVEKTYGLPVIGVVICKVLTSETKIYHKVVSDLADAYDGVVLHWIGAGPLYSPSFLSGLSARRA